MDTFPFGFLQDLYVLTPLAPGDFAAIARQDDFQDVEPDELLLPPSLQHLLTNGEVHSDATFFGTSSFSGTTLAAITRQRGDDVLAQLRATLVAFGRPAEDLLACLPALLRMSTELRACHDEGIAALRATTGENGPKLLPLIAVD